MMHVSLPMYDLPQLIEAHEELWKGLKANLVLEGFDGLRETLEWPVDLMNVWRAPNLFLSQTCGYPLKKFLEGQVQYVGTPVYDAPGCVGFRYASTLIVPKNSTYVSIDDLRGRVAAFNELGSQSGYNALRHAAAPLSSNGRFFGTVIESGRHEESIRLVGESKADIAAIDSVTFALLSKYDPSSTAGVRSIGETVPVAGLPFITSTDRSDEEVQRMRRALAAAFSDPALEKVRRVLLLSGIEFPGYSAYDDVDAMENYASSLGYSKLG